jgi:hypothetical protein
MSEHLGAVLTIGAQGLDPLGREPVLLGSKGARDLSVGDVADEHMPKRVLRLGRHRRAPLPPHELLALEPVQALLHGPALEPVHGGESPAPEDLPEHGRILDERLVLGGERVEPRGDDPLHVLGQRRVVTRSHAALGDHACVLLGIERVSPRAREEGSLSLRGHDRLLEQAAQEARDVFIGERREGDSGRVRLAPAPAGPALEQLRPSGADDKEGRVGHPVDEVIDEVEQIVVGPVEILEHEYQGALLGERLEEAAPGREGFVASVPAGIAFPAQPDERAQVALDPARARRVRNQIGDGLAKLRLGHLGGIGLEDGRLSLDHLRHSPEGDAFAIRQRAALPPEDDQLRIRVDCLGKLPHQSALADARDADEREQLRRPLAPGPAERVREQVELLPPADECGATALPHVDSVTSPGGQSLPDGDRLGLAFRAHRLTRAVLDHPLGGPVGGLADEDAVHRRGSLEARGRVDDVSGHHPFALGRTSPQGNDRLPRVDGDADVQVERRVRLVQLENGLPNGECGADGALRVVLVRDGGPKDRHDRVTDEFLHRPAETLDLRPQAPVVRREHGAHVLRVELLRSSGEADEIGEEDRDDLALFP